MSRERHNTQSRERIGEERICKGDGRLARQRKIAGGNPWRYRTGGEVGQIKNLRDGGKAGIDGDDGKAAGVRVFVGAD